MGSNNINYDFDVIIIGGGPSGLLAADVLSQHGTEVAVLEQCGEIGKDVVCSGVLSKEAFRRYNLPKNSIVGDLKEVELNSPYGLKINYVHPNVDVVVVDRHIFDKELGNNATGNGAKIFTNSRVMSIYDDPEFVQANFKNGAGLKSLKSKIIVIATGISFNLQMANKLGRPKKIIKGIQTEVRAENNEKLRVFWGSQYSEGFFGWSIPLKDGTTRVGVMTEGNAMEGLNNLLTEIGPYTNLCSDNGVIKRKGIAFGCINKSYTDRIIVIGEAAGLVKTTTGGGIFYGLLSAEIASETILHAAGKNNFQSETLSRYETKWKKAIGNEIKFGEYFHNIYSSLDDKFVEELFEASKKDNLLDHIAQNGKFDWHLNTISKILKSPNLRRVLWNGFYTRKVKVAF